MKILLASKDRKLGTLMGGILRDQGFEVELARSEEETGAAVKRKQMEFDAAVADGEEMFFALRRVKNTIPVLLLLKHNTPQRRAQMLNGGADDCLGRPFDGQEFAARVRALTRRRGLYLPEGQLRFSDLELNLFTCELCSGGGTVRLHGKEFKLMKMMMPRGGCVITREEMIRKIWGHDEEEDASLMVYISTLRKKMAALGASASIKTLRSVGYQLVSGEEA